MDTHTKTRTTDCHPFVEVVGYPCSRIINAVARTVYTLIIYTHEHLLRLVSELQLETSYISTNQTTSVSKRLVFQYVSRNALRGVLILTFERDEIGQAWPIDKGDRSYMADTNLCDCKGTTIFGYIQIK